MSALYSIVMLLVAAPVALWQSGVSAQEIRGHLPSPSIHAAGVVSRTLALIGPPLVALHWLHWYLALAGFLSAMCLFSFLFRMWLNRRMNYDRNYLGSTSEYDLSFIVFVTGETRDFIRVHHEWDYEQNVNGYREKVLRAGQEASIFELIATVILAALTCVT